METYNGHVRTPQDAIILFEACRLGVLPRVQRRLSEKERQQIRSGSVFVWDEREAGMRRWTDGKSWSASRVSGSFLTYREMEGKRGGSGFPQPAKKTSAPQSNDGSRSGEGEAADSGEDGPDGYRYKPDGLMKQSFSITTNNGQHLHLISYYARSQPTAAPLKQPSNDPSLRHIRPVKGMYPEATVNESQSAPAVTRGPMSSPPFAPSPQHLAVAPPHGSYPLPPGYPHAYPIWPGSPVGAHPPYGYYIPHPPPPGHAIAYPYYHPHAPSTADPRPPHLQHLPPHHPPPPPATNGHAPPLRHSPYYANGYPPQGAPPASTSGAPPASNSAYAPPPPDMRNHLPSPGLATANLPGPRKPGLQIPQINEHKPLTPPLSASNSVSAPERPHSSGDGAHNMATTNPATNNAGQNSKVLPAIGTLINASADPIPASNNALEANRSRQNSRSPDGGGGGGVSSGSKAATALQPGAAALAMSAGGNDTAGMMAIRALNGRFHKPTT